jgi:hypothetical protein
VITIWGELERKVLARRQYFCKVDIFPRRAHISQLHVSASLDPHGQDGFTCMRDADEHM